MAISTHCPKIETLNVSRCHGLTLEDLNMVAAACPLLQHFDVCSPTPRSALKQEPFTCALSVGTDKPGSIGLSLLLASASALIFTLILALITWSSIGGTVGFQPQQMGLVMKGTPLSHFPPWFGAISHDKNIH